jgi:membrane protease YdiL (CAAX protease family)
VSTDPNLLPVEAMPPESVVPPPRDPAWSLWDVVFTAGLALCASVVITLVLTAILGLRPSAGFDPVLVRAAISAQILAYVLVAAYVYLLVVYHYRQPFLSAIRWRWPEAPLAWLFAGAALSIAVMLLSRYLPIPRGLPVERYFTDRPLAFLLVFFGTAVAPLVEEVFFRGFLYPVLRRRMYLPLAIALTAGIFALIHGAQVELSWAPLLMLFIVGLVLTVVRERTGSVAAPFLIHLAYNGTIFALLAYGTRGFTEMPKVAP